MRLIVKLLPLAFVFLAVGVSVSLYHPFLALFVSDEIDAGPLRTTAFLIVAPLAGVISSYVIGRLSDRRAIRRGLLIAAAVAGVVGSVTAAFVRDYWVLLGLAITAFALAGALFPQTFAYAREVLLRTAPERTAMGISYLRTVFSIAWVGGPPLGAVLLEAGGFRYVYLGSALAYLFALLIAIFVLDSLGPAPAAGPDEPAAPVLGPNAPGIVLILAGVAFTLLQTPLTLGAQALPLFASRDLGGEVSDAGLLLGLCAAIEIPLMLLFGWLSTRVSLHWLILFGAVCGVAYYGIATAATGIGVMVAAQLVNAVFIAAVTGLGISYVQEMLPSEPGRATTLFTNTFPIGAMVAGPLFGVAQSIGFRWAYGISTALCLLGLVVLVVLRPLALSRARTGGANAFAGDRRPA